MTVDNPKVSVLVPIYNVEKYLKQCLDSVVNQTLKDIEIICINDGSTDSSKFIIEDYMRNDPRVKIIDKKNTGYGNSMNMGLDLAKGEYIGIVESDDFADLKMFETLYSLAKKDELDIARSEFYFHENSDGTDTKSNMSFVPHNCVIKPSEEQSVFYQQPSIWASIYRSDFLKKNQIRFLETPGASYQDTAFTFKVYLAASRFEMISDAFIHYRINANSSSFQETTKVFCIVDEYDEIKRYLKESSLWNENRQLVAHLEYNGYNWNYNRLAEPYKSQFAKKWKEIAEEEVDSGDISPEVFSSTELSKIRRLINYGTLTVDPIVSIVVPVYNTEQYLEKCLNSLINQTFDRIEIICVNDGTKDNSQSIVDSFSEKDDRIISVIKKNGGLSSARNAGLKLARGKYVGFVDSDDWVEPSMYERAVNNMDGADAAIMGVNIIGDTMMERREADLKYYSVNYSGLTNLTSDVLFNTHVSAWNKLYRMDIIRNNHIDFPEGLLYEDYAFYWKYFAFCKTAYFDPTPCYNYLRREGSIMYQTLKVGNTRAIEHLQVFENIYDFYKNRQEIHSLDKEDINKMFLNCFWFAYLNLPPEVKIKALRKGTKIVRRYNLDNDKVINALASRDYATVDNRQSYLISVRILSKIVKCFERKTGMDASIIKNASWGHIPPYGDRSKSLTSTEWIFGHENTFKIQRWSTVYDQYSKDSKLNLTYTSGISGVSKIPIVREWLVSGTRLRFYVTLWGAESCILDAVVVYDGRFITGTSICDGKNLFAISVECNKADETISAKAVNCVSMEDFSSMCRIFRIERGL